MEYILGAGLAVSAVGFFILTLINLVVLRELVAAHALIKTLLLYITKLDQVTQATLYAAENFVDALNQYTNQNPHSSTSIKGGPTESFEDLQTAFENQVKEMEDEEDEEDEEGGKKLF